jgi:PHP family Zn ribbon phosphoesterase
VALALGYKSATAAAVQKCWSELIEGRTEIDVLMEADLAELSADPRVLEAIEMFRQGRVEVLPGGGGKYGEVKMTGGVQATKEKRAQKSLFDF